MRSAPLASTHSPRRVRPWVLAILVSALAVTGCTTGDGTEPVAVTAPDEHTRPRTLARDFPDIRDLLGDPKIRRLLRDCPVTRPNHSIAPGAEQNPGAERAAYHGNGRLWTVLYGIARRDRSGVKFPWWAKAESPVAADRPMGLSITGRRLDRRAPSLRARIPPGYGPGFQATAIFFPTAGCWKITGAAGRGSLAFVTLVLEG